MELVTEGPRRFIGPSVITDNEAESKPASGKIQDLWIHLTNNVFGKTITADVVYGVYSDYESDHSGRYQILAGVEARADEKCPEGLTEVVSEGGNYVVFKNSGTMPEVVVRTWQEIWEYFAADDCPHERAYTADYEEYPSETEVVIYVGIK